jgi:hypothetical protein
MGYNLNGLTNGYVDETKNDYIYKTITEGTTASLMTKNTGIKSAQTINIIATRGVWQAKTACNPTASGDSVLTQREITVGGVSVVLEWCEETLETYSTQTRMKQGSTYTDLTFRTQILEDVKQNILADKEKAIWQGDTTSINVYLNKFDGLIKLIAAEGTVNTATPVAWSVANSRTAVQNALIAVTDNMYTSGNLKMFMGLTEARDYRLKLGIDNLYHLTGADAKLYAENSDIEIVPVAGLSGTKKIYVMSPDNMFLGTDLEGEDERFDLKVLENEKLRLTVKFKLGVQVAFPDLIVKQVNT